MFGGGGLQDVMLKTYVDKVFDKYDTDKSGTLDQQEMTVFFNDLFQQLGLQKNVSLQQSIEAIKSIDKNYDGSVDKQQLFLAFKSMMAKSQQMVQSQNFNQPPQGYGGYGQGYGQGYNTGYSQGYPPPQGFGGYPQSPYYPNQSPMYGSQPPMYGNPNPMYNSAPQNYNPYGNPYGNTYGNPYQTGYNPYGGQNPYKKF